MSSPTDLCMKIKNRIKSSEFWTPKSKETGAYLQQIRCPECGSSESWAYKEYPFSIICNRKNECGVVTKTLDLFPDVIRQVEKDYPATKKDPCRPARAYLNSRSLNKSLDGLPFLYKRNVRKTGSGGVLFYVGENVQGEKVYNGRLFNPPVGEGKTHNQGSTSGMFWRHPALEYDPEKPTFLTEGIIDALSFIEMGYQAIAVLSSGQDPKKVDLGDLIQNIVLAFDSDSAGAGGLKKWRTEYPFARAITPLRGDWNDLLCSLPLGKAKKRFDKQYKEFQVRAELLLAETATKYAEIYHEFYGYAAGLFVFNGCYYHSWMKLATAKNPEELITTRASNFTVKVDHYQLDTTIEDEPVNRYHIKIRPKKGRPTSCSVTGAELSASGSLRSMFLTRGRVVWEGDAKASLALAKMVVEAGAPVVRQLQLTGHDLKSGYFAFRDFAIDPNGKILTPDTKGFFRTSRQEYLRPAPQPTVKPKSGGPGAAKIYGLINTAWPHNGALAITFAVASWFVNVIKPEIGFFPFLSLHGDTQTGKTGLTRKLNALQCLDEEGLPMTKLNTGKGEIRKLAQRSGLFKALLEGNNADKIRFDYGSLLPLYNHGNHLQVRALKTNDVQTHETEFLSSLIFVQNTEPFRVKAQLERIISSRPFRAENITPETTEAYNQLAKIPLRQMAFSFIEIMKFRAAIQAAWLPAYEAAREEILSEVPDNRIAENHALILAFHRLLRDILKVDDDIKPFITELAARKVEQCSKQQTTQADHFFSALDALEDHISPYVVETFISIRRDLGELRIQIPEALKHLKQNGYETGHVTTLYDSLRDHDAYKTNGTVNETFRMRSTTQGRAGDTDAAAYPPLKKKWRVWIFDLAKLVRE